MRARRGNPAGLLLGEPKSAVFQQSLQLFSKPSEIDRIDTAVGV